MFERLSDWPEFQALVAELSEFAEALKVEALGLVDGEGLFKPWHEPQIYEGGWDAYGIFWAGREVDRRTKAPVAKELLSSWQSVVFNAGYSRMQPGANIKPHVGYTPDVLRLHLGVYVPELDSAVVGLRVGHEVRGWVEKECVLFDDTQEHCAWNKSAQARVVLLVDLLRPAGRRKGGRA